MLLKTYWQHQLRKKDEWIHFIHGIEWYFHPFYTAKWRTWFNEWDTWQKITIKLGFSTALGCYTCEPFDRSQCGISFSFVDRFSDGIVVSDGMAHQVNCLLTFVDSVASICIVEFLRCDKRTFQTTNNSNGEWRKMERKSFFLFANEKEKQVQVKQDEMKLWQMENDEKNVTF